MALLGMMVRRVFQTANGCGARSMSSATTTATLSPSVQLTQAQKDHFSEQGFLILPEFIAPSLADQMTTRFSKLFRGEFETGVYPDEWHWREGLSFPHVTREICNAWKSDRLIAGVALSAALGQVCHQLSGWSGARIAQDDIWWKPPGSSTVAMHQDAPYFDFFDPADVITFWIALDDTNENAGTLKYVPGSHKWTRPTPSEKKQQDTFDKGATSSSILTPKDEDSFTRELRAAAAFAGKNWTGIKQDIVSVIVPKGGCAIHHHNMWHGSGPNTTTNIHRRSLAVHLLPAHSTFSLTHSLDGSIQSTTNNTVGYIYGRYQKRSGSVEERKHMSEDFFPIIWRQDGYRSPFLREHCDDRVLATLNR
eukprot:GILK01004455.1.p1 GENE.GILK01004455.1~~GILK01004455.1.p1  ORF type:complete len:379 (-),score=49.31 GILK01004455.1:91-1185(-)